MSMLIEGNGGDASTTRTGLRGIPAIEGGIGGDMQRKAVEGRHALEVEGNKVGDVVFVKGLGKFGQDHIAIVWGDGGCDPRAVAPEQFLFSLKVPSGCSWLVLFLTPRRQSGSPGGC